MAKETGIPWTDSTFNSWWGCTKVGPACDHCYAEAVDLRTQQSHWGAGVPRRLLSENARNEPYRWQRAADKFRAENGRDRRVFTLSMGDLFDNEVPSAWRADHMHIMEQCNRLQWQVCTKRIGNVEKMVPPNWLERWPQHVGMLITVVDQKEADRDIPKLLRLKSGWCLPWVGLSMEPILERVDLSPYLRHLDWIILGGESGKDFRAWDGFVDYARDLRNQCADAGTAFFMKQMSAYHPADTMIPADLMVREFPHG